jgi:hypothetical protein
MTLTWGNHHLPLYNIIFSWTCGLHPKMSFCPGTPKLRILIFPKLGLLSLWRPITFCVDLQLRWGPHKSCSSCWKLFNDMWHVTYPQVNKGDYGLLMVENQINNLIIDPSFGHNLCFKYSNGTCKPILNIYI